MQKNIRFTGFFKCRAECVDQLMRMLMNKSDGICKRIRYNKDGATEYTYTLHSNFEDWMDGGCLVVDVIGNAYTNDLLLETVPVYCGIYRVAVVDRDQ